MLFEARVVARRTLTTWWSFTAIALVTSTVAILVNSCDDPDARARAVIATTVAVGGVAFVLCWVFAPVAWLLGRALKRAPGAATVAAFGALGFVVCFALAMIVPGTDVNA
ncbi:hypothetical protein [Microbacterium oleivorans]|uniref:hypothetical protein n=1 Tax=Microbacterium TaxID=33882 RepID=UPI00203AFD31|nr:hypothetical protein [Microbacterium oleivorans]MCM3695643.1 hypothetical protein [Microbacterium oleivorans]